MRYIFQLSKLLNLFDADVDDGDDIDDDNDNDDGIDDDNSLNLDPTSEDILNARSAPQRPSTPQKQFLSFMGRRICATRHGCTGATNCDSAYGTPIGR